MAVTSLDGVISTRVRLGGRVIFQSSAGGDALAAHASRFIVSKSVSKIVDGEVVGSKWVGAGGPESS
jgi:hypothetical protein